MKLLCAVPPYVPSYFNAGHHLPVFQVGAFLRQRDGDAVVCRDLAALNASWRDVCRLLLEDFDAIVLFNDFDGIGGFGRFVDYARELVPGTPLATFGRASKQVPAFFERYGVDAIACGGDYEAAISTWRDQLAGTGRATGVLLREGDRYVETPPAAYLDPDDWALPDVDDIPYAAYDRLYGEDLDKFCGIPGRRELVVPVARGCPIGCDFCDVPVMQGLRERRLDVDRVVAYIDAAAARAPFEYVSFYAPTFTLKRRWVIELCDQLEPRAARLPWKCVTTTYHLDRELIERMGAAGCVRISVGVETLTPAATAHLPRPKQRQDEHLTDLLGWCGAAGIELNCFLILGLPGDRPAAARETIEWLLAQGARVRPTLLTPYDRMTADMTESDFAAFNRQTFIEGLVSREDAAEYYDLLFANAADRRTEVAALVPTRGSGAAHALTC